MKITDWPEAERPREKILSQGPSFLSDAELLAILLRTGTRGLTAVDFARGLLTEFGSISGLLSAEKSQILGVKGLGTSKYAQLIATKELSLRCAHDALRKGDVLSDINAVETFLLAKMETLEREVFAVILLDNQHQLIRYKSLFFGTINSAAVYPREIVKQVLQDNAAAVILAHNHPSGVAEPSEADLAITKSIQNALALIDVRVLDHFVVGHQTTVSFAQRGLI
jgi:DNA repair protein RadC